MADIQSPHTNSARLPSYIGRTVRLWGKLLKVIVILLGRIYRDLMTLPRSYKVTQRSCKPVMVVKSK